MEAVSAAQILLNEGLRSLFQGDSAITSNQHGVEIPLQNGSSNANILLQTKNPEITGHLREPYARPPT